MFPSSYKIAEVWGIPIKVHISLLLLLGLIGFLAARSGFGNLLMVILLEVGAFTSISLHELGHSFVAIRKGCRVREITLMVIGGAAHMEDIPRRPRDELLMAVAGPAVSVVLACACLFIGGRLSVTEQPWELPRVLRFTGVSQVSCNLIELLGFVNAGLALFNLLPAFPMDGGRVLRALLARRLGRLRATLIASRLGRIIAMVLVLVGILNIRRDLSALLWVVLGIFLNMMAKAEYRQVQQQEAARRAGGLSEVLMDDEALADQVVISPPPYERRRRGERADIFVERGRRRGRG